MQSIIRSVFSFSLVLLSLIAHAGPGNIAPSATITASTSLNKNFNARNLTDGIIGINGIGEWACERIITDWGYIRFPWIQLDWNQEQLINRIVLFDRASANEHIAGGKLLFSDGSVIWVNQLKNDGAGKSISFPSKKISWVRFVVTDGTGKDLGLSEMEVYPAAGEGVDFVSRVDP